MAPKILLDCDPGVDDMFAIFCAVKYSELVAVTSVGGNVGIEYTTRNALAVLELANAAHVPVHRGAPGPIDGSDLKDARHVHGDTGLGGVELAAPTRDVESNDAVGALLDLTADGDVTVVAIGPLTNIALAIERDPDWIHRIPRLVIMGGDRPLPAMSPRMPSSTSGLIPRLRRSFSTVVCR
jgi:purine nucleosidase